MEYQALARKYRPRNFASLMGQEHVSKALGNALRTKRLHHAYLFSGTRGVGKTTIARILAKSLNCEKGIVAEPCGLCSICREIDEGRFIDLIEVDAASKTKVEDTREMLDNVQYAPVRGRFKVYLIDEVHMLSGHSFNALLKTLEEPPEHVKFLLATTDPQKLPITVLSRCLQFNLRHLSLQQISKQLTIILTQEQINFEEEAIYPIAQAADGSMRDALSLLDQAIAFSDGKLSLSNIDSMLGNIPSHHILGVLSALVENNARQMMHTLHEILSLGMGVDNVLTELINAIQKMAMLQMLPELSQNVSEETLQNRLNDSYEQKLAALAKQISAEDIQLYYQIALSGRADLELSPFPQAALEMILLRILAFRPVVIDAAAYLDANSSVVKNLETADNSVVSSTLVKKKDLKQTKTEQIIEAEVNAPIKVPDKTPDTRREPQIPGSWIEENNKADLDESDLSLFWNDCVNKIECTGIEKEIILHCCLLEKRLQNGQLFIKLGLDKDHQALLNNELHKRIEQKLQDYFSSKKQADLKIQEILFKIIILSEPEHKHSLTPKQTKKKKLQMKIEQATCSINEDPNVQLLIKHFSGKIIPGSIIPL